MIRAGGRGGTRVPGREDGTVRPRAGCVVVPVQTTGWIVFSWITDPSALPEGSVFSGH